jgi:hypothetical protein
VRCSGRVVVGRYSDDGGAPPFVIAADDRGV